MNHPQPPGTATTYQADSERGLVKVIKNAIKDREWVGFTPCCYLMSFFSCTNIAFDRLWGSSCFGMPLVARPLDLPFRLSSPRMFILLLVLLTVAPPLLPAVLLDMVPLMVTMTIRVLLLPPPTTPLPLLVLTPLLSKRFSYAFTTPPISYKLSAVLRSCLLCIMLTGCNKEVFDETDRHERLHETYIGPEESCLQMIALGVAVADG